MGVVVLEVEGEVNGEPLIDTGVAPAEYANFRGDIEVDLFVE